MTWQNLTKKGATSGRGLHVVTKEHKKKKKRGPLVWGKTGGGGIFEYGFKKKTHPGGSNGLVHRPKRIGDRGEKQKNKEFTFAGLGNGQRMGCSPPKKRNVEKKKKKGYRKKGGRGGLSMGGGVEKVVCPSKHCRKFRGKEERSERVRFRVRQKDAILSRAEGE